MDSDGSVIIRVALDSWRAGPGLVGRGCVLLGHLIAVAEHVGDERGRNFGDERAEGCAACTVDVDADFPEAPHERVGWMCCPARSPAPTIRRCFCRQQACTYFK